MAQKSNLSTVRKTFRVFFFSFNVKPWLVISRLLENLLQLFFNKNVSIIKYIASLQSNCLYLTLSLFYHKKKLLNIEKKKCKTKPGFQRLKNSLIYDIKAFLSLYNITAYVLNCKVYNFNLHKKNLRKTLKFFFKKLKVYRASLFARRTTLFYDFLHLTCLFISKKVSLDYYVQLWSRIFRFISKKLHTRFLSLVKATFELITSSYPRYQKKRIFRGIKFVISGRFKAKARASCHLVKFGMLPTQSISKQIQFSNLKAHTLYGIFGIKIWYLMDQLSV